MDSSVYTVPFMNIFIWQSTYACHIQESSLADPGRTLQAITPGADKGGYGLVLGFIQCTKQNGASHNDLTGV